MDFSRYRHLIQKYLPVIYIVLGIGYCIIWLLAYVQDKTWMSDFTAFYTAGSLLRHGHIDGLYDFTLQAQHQQLLLGDNHFGGGYLAFYYPPYVALLFFPFSFLSLKHAYLLWSLSQFLFLGVGAWLWSRRLERDGWSRQAILYLLSGAIALPSFRSALQLGTVTFILFAVLLLLYYALEDQRDWLAALCLVAGMLKPQVIFLPVLLVLAMRRWRIIGYAAVMYMALFGMTTFLLGEQVWFDMVAAMTSAYARGTAIGVTPTAMYNLKGLLVLLFGQNVVIDTFSLVLFALSGVGVIYLGNRYRMHSEMLSWLMGVTVVMGTLFGLHVNPQDGLYLVIAAMCVTTFARNWSVKSNIREVLACGPFLFLVYESLIRSWFGVQFSVLYMLWMLVILALLARIVISQRSIL